MKTQLNLYLDIDLVERLLDEAKVQRTKPSALVTTLLWKTLKKDEHEEHQSKFIVCSECSVRYSSIFQKCPNCEHDRLQQLEIKNEIEQKETEASKLRFRLYDEKTSLIRVHKQLVKDKRTDEAENIKKDIEQIEKELELLSDKEVKP